MIAFGIYLCVLGVGLFLSPNTLLAIFGEPPTTEPWLRVLGVVSYVLGGYYIFAGHRGVTPFYHFSITGRVVGAIGFMSLVSLGDAPNFVLLFAALDGLGALWTWSALRRTG